MELLRVAALRLRPGHPSRMRMRRRSRTARCGLLRYGNAAVGLWGSVPAQADPEWIAERLSWVQPRAAGRPARPGAAARVRSRSVLRLATRWTALPGLAQEPAPRRAADRDWTTCRAPTPDRRGTRGVPASAIPIRSRARSRMPDHEHLPGRLPHRSITGRGHLPAEQAVHYDPPGTNFLPTVYTDMFDARGKEMPNTLPSTPTVPYNLHDGEPVVRQINPISPDGRSARRSSSSAIAASSLDRRGSGTATTSDTGAGAGRDPARASTSWRATRSANRAYSGFPLLHYNGPEKVKKVQPIKDDERQA